MPRVTEEHLASRRRQILDAARRCFSRAGFHQTSMQDILTEAGLSAGAVYRYFRSKTEIVKAIADETITQVLDQAAVDVHADPPVPLPDLIGTLITAAERQLEPDGVLRMAIQVWGESVHNPELAASVADTYRRIRAVFIDYARRARAAGQLPAGSDPEQVGAVLFGLMPGYIMQRALLGDVDRERYLGGLTALLGPR
jgi:AcrR family transcriptional regulator